MSRTLGGEVAAIGALPLVGGFALAGVRVCTAETGDEVRAAWHSLPDTVGVVILSEAAAAVVAASVDLSTSPRLTVVMPP
jgi:vacuolar-type H+-ATPase subunit F/Vma7